MNDNLKKILIELQNFDVDDLVIHKKYGLCIFKGIKELTFNGNVNQCFELEFNKSSKLLLPIHKMDVISRHSKNGFYNKDIELDSVGSSAFANKKERIFARIMAMASDIIDLAAVRKRIKSRSFKDCFLSEEYKKFEENFTFTETKDQVIAINDIIEDLSKESPMQRLVCGDTGFGKTEVVMRAVCGVVCGKLNSNQGGQVVFISPTTFLAKQHFKTLKKRFDCFGDEIKIDLLISDIGAKKRTDIYEKIKGNKIDILVATHSAFGKNLEFADLQLIVIDEEHVFGVKQKDILKQKYPHAHLVYLSATPIPRTFQQGLHGLCDISLISTPPVSRKRPESFIITENKDIFDAVEKEMNRGGNVLCIVPRIEDIDGLVLFFKEKFKNLNISSLHGEMTSVVSEAIVDDFSSKKIDILISTTVCAFGMDFEYANSMFIFNPHYFGLGQLYQIKGRVGRRDKIGYCYFVVDVKTLAREDIMRRINVVKNANDFGSGFEIASCDYDIRGGGNILGKEQSGDIKDIGIEFYQEMLEVALNSDGRKEKIDVDIEISGIKNYIPDFYIKDNKTKIDYYRKIASLTTNLEHDLLIQAIENDFGKIPDECFNLFLIAKIKILCKEYFIDKAMISSESATLRFIKNDTVKAEKLVGLLKNGVKIIDDSSVKLPITNKNIYNSIMAFLDEVC